jgi:hypothetical protein
MTGVVHLGYRIGIFELTAFLFWRVFEANREGAQIGDSSLRLQRHQKTGVETAEKQHTHRHVRHFVTFTHRFAQGVVDYVQPRV